MSRGIEHRLTRPNHPWSHEDQKPIRGIVFLIGGQIERMNRTIKDATVKRFQNDSHDRLRTHLADVLAACNFARRLKTPNGLKHTNTSAGYGHPSRNDSSPTRSTGCRD